MTIGRDLLDMPFAELVRNLALAIAEGQTALDRNSLNTLKELVEEEVDVLTDLVETISPAYHQIPIDVTDQSGVMHHQSVLVTGARVTTSGVAPLRMNMLQAGIFPTFYQFTEATIDVKLSITMREDQTTQVRSATNGRTFLGLGASRAYASSVDYRNHVSYNYQAQGASSLRAVIRPVPPPSRLQPTTTTINTFTTPPTVTRT